VNRLLDLVPDDEDGPLARASEPEVPVVEEEVDTVLFGLDRIVERARADDLQVGRGDLVTAGRAAVLARTTPVTATDVSMVSSPKRSQTSLGRSVFTNTTWAIPVPSRMTANATLPDERTCVTQARRRTAAPTWSGRSAIRTTAVAGDDVDVEGVVIASASYAEMRRRSTRVAAWRCGAPTRSRRQRQSRRPTCKDWRYAPAVPPQ
jgi:hypothetical protein